MKLPFILLALLMALSGYGQVNFIQAPVDFQLYPRIGDERVADAVIRGTVPASLGYSSLSAKLTAGQTQIDDDLTILNYANGEAQFELRLTIPVTRRNHEINIYADDSGSPIRSASNVVAGDVYVINGQSNALASTAIFHEDRDSFVRGFNGPENFNFWSYPGWTELHKAYGGLWMGRTTKQISTDLDLPIAVFNFAVGGQRLSFFEPGNASGNYNRLVSDLSNAGVLGKVHSFYWSQGESDSYNNISLREYKTRLKNLFQSYKTTLGTDRFFMFQTRPLVCFAAVPFIYEAQRRLANELDFVTIIGTTNAQIDSDSCHFDYERGYGVLGNRLAGVLRDRVYGRGGLSTTSPQPDSARITGSNQVTVYWNVPGSSMTNTGEPWNDFIAEGINVRAVSGFASGNTVVLNFNTTISTATGLSYAANRDTLTSAIHNTEGVGAIAFYDLSLIPGDGAVNRPIDLELSLSADQSATTIGQIITVTVNIQNKGGTTSTDAIVKVPLPQGVIYEPRGAFEPQPGTAVLDSSLTWTIPTLRPDAQAQLRIEYEVINLARDIVVYAQVLKTDQSRDPDSTPGNASTYDVKEDDEARIVLNNRQLDCQLKASLQASFCAADSSANWILSFASEDNQAMDIDYEVTPTDVLRWKNAASGTLSLSFDTLAIRDTLPVQITITRPTDPYGCTAVFANIYAPDSCKITFMPMDTMTVDTMNTDTSTTSTTVVWSRLSKSIRLYPNPVKSGDKISLILTQPVVDNETVYQVFNAVGEEVRREKANHQQFSIDTSGLIPGLYFVRINGAISRVLISD